MQWLSVEGESAQGAALLQMPKFHLPFARNVMIMEQKEQETTSSGNLWHLATYFYSKISKKEWWLQNEVLAVYPQKQGF